MSPTPSRLRKSSRFYVGGLPIGVSEGSLRDAFEHVGVHVGFVEIVLTASTGLPRGFAFVDFPGGAANTGASAFLAQLRTAQLGGRPLTITEIPELEERLGSQAAVQHAGSVSAPERAAIESWDDEGGRNAP